MDTDGSKYTEKELIFPRELLLRGNGGMILYRPLRLQYLLDLREKHPAHETSACKTFVEQLFGLLGHRKETLLPLVGTSVQLVSGIHLLY